VLRSESGPPEGTHVVHPSLFLLFLFVFRRARARRIEHRDA
jgi:hypothetical protein